MEERNTDPRILMLILSVLNYIEAKNEPTNPFVKGFGVTENTKEAYEDLLESVADCQEYFPEIDEMVAAYAEQAMENETELSENNQAENTPDTA
jgi:hypothetical protein